MESEGQAAHWLTPAEMAAACDVSLDTLRYYEKEGLLDQVSRTSSGQRRYTDHDVGWVRVLRCLRVTAMPIRDMRRFAELVRVGDDAMGDRLDILRSHRAEVVSRIDELHRAIEMIDEKIAAYTDAVGTPLVELDPADAKPTLDGKGART